LVTFLCFWNVIFLNSAANIIRCYYTLQRHVLYDISKEVHDIREKNKHISGFCFTGNLQTYAMNNFAKLYPIIYRTVPEPWYVPAMAQLAIIDYELAESFIKYIPVNKLFDQSKYESKRLAKSTSLYDIFIWDEKVNQVNFKSFLNCLVKGLNYAKIGEED